MNEARSTRWWGDFDVAERQWARWRVGPLTLWACAGDGEWRLAWRSSTDPLENTVAIDIPADAEPPLDELELARFALEPVGGGLRLAPQLADLPVVVRPETPLWVPSGQRTVLYVGTAIWVGVHSTGSGTPLLVVLPVIRPSDTWFGSNTRDGEICYASRTRARTRVELLGHIPHRAITPVEIVNKAADTLQIEQLRIPVTALRLYDAEGQLWTDGIGFTRELGGSAAEFDILPPAKYLPERRQPIAEPHAPLQRRAVVEAFSSLFG